MEHSMTYSTIQKVIQQGLLASIFPDLPKTLEILEAKGLLTEVERQALLELANTRKSDGPML